LILIRSGNLNKLHPKNFLDKYWYDGKRNEDEVSLGYDDNYYIWYGFDFFSLNKANENLAKYDESNIVYEYHHDYNNSCIKYTICDPKHDDLCLSHCNGIYCKNHQYHVTCIPDNVSISKDHKDQIACIMDNTNAIINVAAKLYKSEIENDESYWLLDGGASMHITPHLSDFSEYREYQTPVRVKTANKNAEAEILGEGKIYIQNQIGDIKREMMTETRAYS
jgi:hypothetical protein